MLRRLPRMALLCLSFSLLFPPEARPETPSVSSQAVVTYHPKATEIGYAILDRGGNAFDAFVAATAAEYVLAEGTSSLAGPLGALVYDAKTKTTSYLDAGFNTPLDPKQKWDANDPKPGTASLVPGAIAGLEALSKKYGKLSFREVLEPAIRLAEHGFPISALYAALIRSPEYGGNLKRSDYGRRTYFKDGKPLAQGETLRLPVMARFLRKLATQGSEYAYRGEWARECLSEVNGQGGHLLRDDFTTYRAEWRAPWRITYRGYEIHSPAINGGLNTLVALKVLEHAELSPSIHYSKDADALELLIRVQNEVNAERWLHDVEKTADAAFLAMVFSPSYLAGIWDRVKQKLYRPQSVVPGTHSYHIVVVDKSGNAVTGTHTIESFPWGNGIFVEGVPLTASGTLPFNTKPGKRRLSPLSMHLGMREGTLRFASGAFSASLIPAEFQFIVNLIDYRASARDAVSLPRFGAEAWDLHTRLPVGGLWLDRRIDRQIVETLTRRGLKLIQHGYIDTGLGAVAVEKDGELKGAIAPLP